MIYDEYKKGREKVFFNIKNGKFTSVVVGKRSVSHEAGVQFYVDNYVAEQINKCELYFDESIPKLRLKDGETLYIPKENEEYKRRKEIEELKRRLRELSAE